MGGIGSARMVERSVDRSFSSSISPIRMLRRRGEMVSRLVRMDILASRARRRVRKGKQSGGAEKWDAHHVSFDEVETERNLFDAFLEAVHALLGFRKDDIRLLVVARHNPLIARQSRFQRDTEYIGESDRTTIARPSCRMRSTRPARQMKILLEWGSAVRNARRNVRST